MYRKKDDIHTKLNRKKAKERYYVLKKSADFPFSPLVIAKMDFPLFSFDLLFANFALQVCHLAK